MIKSYADYRRYLEHDAERGTFKRNLKEYLFNDIWRFQRALRWAEYLYNTKPGAMMTPLRLWAKFRYKRLAKKLGYSIPMNVFGPGLSLPHYGNIVVNRHARIGANCRVHIGVNIGAGFDDGNSAPQLGDNCYIAPGAKLYGDIRLGNNTKIGANAVVNKSFVQDNLVLVGIPAKPLRGEKDAKRLLEVQTSA